MVVTVEGLDINYIDVGAGECILLLHGWGANIQAWRPVYEFFSKDYRVLAIDFPGFGDSPEPPEGGSAFGVRDYARVVRGFLEKLGITRTHIIAHSFGGRVSIVLANETPALIGQLVLADAAGVKPRRKLSYYIRVYTYKLLKGIYRAGLFKKTLENRMQGAGSADYRALSDNMKRTFIKVVNEDLTPRLAGVKAPTLLMWGENDQETPLYMAKLMEKRIPDSGLVVLNGAGHFSYLDSQGEFLKIVSVFLKGRTDV